MKAGRIKRKTVTGNKIREKVAPLVVETGTAIVYQHYFFVFVFCGFRGFRFRYFVLKIYMFSVSVVSKPIKMIDIFRAK